MASLPSEFERSPGAGYTPIWEWISIIPGVIHLPFTSITLASVSNGISPMAVILLFSIRMEALSSSSPDPVSTLALRIKIVSLVSGL